MKTTSRGSPAAATRLPDAVTTAIVPRCRDSTRSARLTSTRTGGAPAAAADRGLLPVVAAGAGCRPIAAGRVAILLAEDAALAGGRASGNRLRGRRLARLCLLLCGRGAGALV